MAQAKSYQDEATGGLDADSMCVFLRSITKPIQSQMLPGISIAEELATGSSLGLHRSSGAQLEVTPMSVVRPASQYREGIT